MTRTVVVAGKNQIAIDTVEMLVAKAEYLGSIKALINKTDDGQNNWQPSFKAYCENKGIEIVNLDDLYAVDDLVFISTEYDTIIRPGKFKAKELYNIHFSLLPAYKGMFTSVMPILNGEKYSGVTLHRIDSGIDTGDIIAQRKFAINEWITAFDLYKLYLSNARILLKENIAKLLKGDVNSIPQQSDGSSYYSKSEIDFGKVSINLNKSAHQVRSQVHAFSFRPYQLPKVLGNKITHALILKSNSFTKPGIVISSNEYFTDLSTIDYDIRLFHDILDVLIQAINQGDGEIVKEAISLGLRVDDQNERGWSLLMVAAYNGSINLVEFLVKKGANVNAFNHNGTSVLMYALTNASKTKNYDLLDFLLQHSIDFSHRDYYGKSALEWANYYNDREVINRLDKTK